MFILETLRLLPWWGWLIAYAPIAYAVASWGESVDKDHLERTGLQPTKDSGENFHQFCFLAWICFAIYAENSW